MPLPVTGPRNDTKRARERERNNEGRTPVTVQSSRAQLRNEYHLLQEHGPRDLQ